MNNVTTVINKTSEHEPQTDQDCFAKYAGYALEKGAEFCNATFDSYLCWPPTKVNTSIQQNCPKVRLSDPSSFAYRKCGPLGLWEGRRSNEASATGWTNFTPCFPPEIQKLFVQVFNDDHDQNTFQVATITRQLEIVGFTISMISMMVCLFIYNYFRSLRNYRTRIHRNLFRAMLVQVIIRLVLYLDQMFYRAAPASVRGNIDNTPYLCEAGYIILENANSYMFSWMLIEGIYLNNYITKNSMRANFDYVLYRAAAWCIPVIFTIAWATVTGMYYDPKGVKTCWYGYNFSKKYWILQGPRLAVILINLMFLLNIMRTLIVKLRETPSSELEKIKKAVKAALVLLPLLGITNILSMIEVSVDIDSWKFSLWSYTTHFLRSFQGFFLSLIYCFLNAEVRAAIMRRFHNYRAIRFFRAGHQFQDQPEDNNQTGPESSRQTFMDDLRMTELSECPECVRAALLKQTENVVKNNIQRIDGSDESESASHSVRGLGRGHGSVEGRGRGHGRSRGRGRSQESNANACGTHSAQSTVIIEQGKPKETFIKLSKNEPESRSTNESKAKSGVPFI